MQTKFIFVTGGVVSSLGKGLTAASIALLLEARGYKIGMLKLDPYLNVDPGTMSPFQHGEVYVTDDGAETDLDLGHYHRFTKAKIGKLSNTTSGQIYDEVIKKERRGEYLGKTVQVIPHVTDEIKQRIYRVVKESMQLDVLIIEIGGTTGDIESLPFMEAIRQFRYENPAKCLNIHLTYVPYLKAAGEVKTKPTQHSVQTLRSIGIVPDIILCRCEKVLEEEIKQKISLFCSVPESSVFDEPDVEHTIYEVPLMLHAQKLDAKVCELLSLKDKACDLKDWEKMVHKFKNPKHVVTIGIVGKYLQHQDAYKSVFEALMHAAIYHESVLKIIKFESDKIEANTNLKTLFKGIDGILVPGGFGERGWEGKILAAKYCREHKLPYFGICLGMQVLCTEFARNKAELKNANSTEMDPETKIPVISLLSEQKDVLLVGGSMRLGAYPCSIAKHTKAYEAYKNILVYERHRHRYEFNGHYKKPLEDKGLVFSGVLADGSLCEIAEVKDHPWMVGVQFHPEFLSKPVTPHPLFRDFIGACLKQESKHG
jgi:CTP synthase